MATVGLSVLFLPLLLPTRPQHEEIGNATSTRRRRTAAGASDDAAEVGGGLGSGRRRRSRQRGDGAEIGGGRVGRRHGVRRRARPATPRRSAAGRRWSRQVRRRPRQVVSAEGRRSAAASAGCLGGGARTAAASAGCLGDAGKVGGRRRRWSAPALDLGALRKSDAGGEEKSRIGREGERIEGKAVGPTIGQAFLAGYIWPVQGELWPVGWLGQPVSQSIEARI
uniref:Uncharacterized protein n=1 Tax=Oryza sativa subsp. japonica TaxID=39947 RepID=Q94LR6_ORYSJ|nr:hypothetical protein [Oryza sativa Japonica Group]